jgi:fatty-acyl-CoA synthase
MKPAPGGVGSAEPVDIGPQEVAQAAGTQRQRLLEMGVGAGDAVGWLAWNGVAGLGLLRACEELGARFVPLNWRLAPAELATIAVHAGLQLLLHDEACAGLAQTVGAVLPEAVPRAPGHEPGDLMLVYTSGTTGTPKGAVHTAAAMQANARAAVLTQGLGPATRTLAVLPMFHVGGLCIQVLPTLAAAGRVRLHPRFDPGAWLRDVQAWRPTTSLLVPATMRAVVEHPDWGSTDLSSLAFISAGSSVVPPALIEAFHARGVPVAQVYGSTETGPVSIVLPPQEALTHLGKVGHPAPGVRVRLLGVDGRDVADGEVGEILVSGDNVMRGYHREPEHPAFQGGWFHSGDLAWRDAEGRYEVVGRSKDMVISGGENIYPAEIENLLEGLPGLLECAAVGVPDTQWGEVVVLAVVRRAGDEAGEQARLQPDGAPAERAASPPRCDETSVRSALEGRLARYKHPKRIVFVPSLPKTALGKVRKAELVAQLQGD